MRRLPSVLSIAAACLALPVALWAATSPPPKPAAACGRPECRQFDFWAGDWDVYGPDGTTIVGRSHVESILDGCVLLENWYGAKGGTGKSFNTWTRSDSLWHQSWVSNSGSLLLLSGSFHDGRMVLEGDSPPGTRNRITWSPLPNGEVEQRWTTSADGGVTWQTAFLGTYRRKGATAGH